MSRAAAFLSAAAYVAIAPAVAAQVEVQTALSASVVEQDTPFQLQLRVSAQSSAAGTPSNPRLSAPGLTVQGPSLAPQTRISIINGQMIQSSGVTATWTLVAPKPGKFRIGPPSIEIGGKVVQGEAKTIEVVPPGTTRRRPGGIPGQPFDPFDIFNQFRNFGFGFPDDDFDTDALLQPSVPPEFAIDTAPDPTAFVVAKVVPERVVVGQAVRYSVYAYGGRGAYRIQSATEPSRAGFLAHHDSPGQQVVDVPIQGRTFIAYKAVSLVLFPIQTGTLRIGPTRLGFAGRGYRPTPPDALLTRASNPIDVVVVEPPVAGRPPGYRLGDVGQYTLSATVEPRKVRQGESVSVIAKLEGTGNVPAQLNEPLQTGVEWQDPTSVEDLEAIEGTVRGSRVFTYVVRLDKAGTVDLGALTLPYYDADQRRYAVARAALGSVEVSPAPSSAKPVAAAQAPEDKLRGILKPRRSLEAVAAPARPLTDRTLFWLLLALGPLGVLTANGVLRVSANVTKRLRERRNLPSEHATRELAGARDAANRGELAIVAPAVERAVHWAIEGSTGLKSRGVLRSELPKSLVERGWSPELAKTAAELLEETEHARFAGSGGAGEALALFDRAETFVRAALRGGRA